MNVKEATRKEIEAKLATLGDYVKMDYLESCLKNRLDFDTKKFVLIKLAGIYEVRKMFLDAGRAMRLAADINTTTQGKITDYLKSAELFIKSGSFDEADVSVMRAINDATDSQKETVYSAVKEYYRTHAKLSIAKSKRAQAIKMYERMLNIRMSPQEREEVKKELLELYNQTGKVREYYALKRTSDKSI